MQRPLALTLAALGGLAAAALAMAQGKPAPRIAPQDVVSATSPVQPIAPQPTAANSYPFYMPMQGLKRPVVKMFVKCEASRRAGKEVYAEASAQSIGGRAEGGYEIIFEASDSAGNPCVYPFYPWLPQVVGSLDHTQYILRSSVPGRQVTFRTADQWATINLRLFDFGRQRVHFEMSDIALDFPGAVQPKGGLHLETFGGQAPGLFTAVIRRSKVFGGKNGLFVPGGQTMLYIEDSEFSGNVGSNVDQEHTTYINGILVSHFRNCVWRGQHGWQDVASGHQLKDKAYLRVYENVTVTNTPNGSAPSAMPLVDISAMGFTWANNLTLKRLASAQAPRDALVDLRSEILYGGQGMYPWNPLVDGSWRMPAQALGVLDKVYLSVFFNTRVESFRSEPFVFALRPQGTGLNPGTTMINGNELTAPAQQREVSLAFNTSGRFSKVYGRPGWAFVNPILPANARWVSDRDMFIRHALGLIGR